MLDQLTVNCSHKYPVIHDKHGQLVTHDSDLPNHSRRLACRCKIVMYGRKLSLKQFLDFQNDPLPQLLAPTASQLTINKDNNSYASSLSRFLKD